MPPVNKINFQSWYHNALLTVVAFLFWQAFIYIKEDYSSTKSNVNLLMLNAQQQKLLIDQAIGVNERQDNQIERLDKEKIDKKINYRDE